MTQVTRHTGFSGLLQKVNEQGFADVIFDLDGTLVDSAPGIVRTILHVLAVNEITPVRTVDHTLVGPPLEAMFEMIIEKKDRPHLNTLIDGYKCFYDLEGYKESKPFEGVDETMLFLKDMGKGMHIATNKRYTPTQSILRYLGWEKNFNSVYAVDSHGTRFANKADMLARVIQNQVLAKEAVLYVGDTKNDEEAAAANGIAYYHAFWGYDNS